MRTPLALLALVLALPAWSATVPIGPPVSHLGDPLPIPVRTLWVDRASRGGPCSDTNACTSQTAPCCTLARANQVSQAGDRIEVRAGANGGADGYWEADEAGGKWNIATLSVSTNGTARCVAGDAGWLGLHERRRVPGVDVRLPASGLARLPGARRVARADRPDGASPAELRRHGV